MGVVVCPDCRGRQRAGCSWALRVGGVGSQWQGVDKENHFLFGLEDFFYLCLGGCDEQRAEAASRQRECSQCHDLLRIYRSLSQGGQCWQSRGCVHCACKCPRVQTHKTSPALFQQVSQGTTLPSSRSGQQSSLRIAFQSAPSAVASSLQFRNDTLCLSTDPTSGRCTTTLSPHSSAWHTSEGMCTHAHSPHTKTRFMQARAHSHTPCCRVRHTPAAPRCSCSRLPSAS